MYLVMCEISYKPILNVWIVCNATQDLGTLEGSLWIGVIVVEISDNKQYIK